MDSVIDCFVDEQVASFACETGQLNYNGLVDGAAPAVIDSVYRWLTNVSHTAAAAAAAASLLFIVSHRPAAAADTRPPAAMTSFPSIVIPSRNKCTPFAEMFSRPHSPLNVLSARSLSPRYVYHVLSTVQLLTAPRTTAPLMLSPAVNLSGARPRIKSVSVF